MRREILPQIEEQKTQESFVDFQFFARKAETKDPAQRRAGVFRGDLQVGDQEVMDIQVNDILTMKKAHPCGSKQWLVLRTGADFKLRCLGCGHEVMGARSKFEKNIRQVERP